MIVVVLTRFWNTIYRISGCFDEFLGNIWDMWQVVKVLEECCLFIGYLQVLKGREGFRVLLQGLGEASGGY